MLASALWLWTLAVTAGEVCPIKMGHSPGQLFLRMHLILLNAMSLFISFPMGWSSLGQCVIGGVQCHSSRLDLRNNLKDDISILGGSLDQGWVTKAGVGSGFWDGLPIDQ